jgi:hypothetical protein
VLGLDQARAEEAGDKCSCIIGLDSDKQDSGGIKRCGIGGNRCEGIALDGLKFDIHLRAQPDACKFEY